MNNYPRQGTASALFVIDIQEDYTGRTARPPFPYKNSEELIATVNKLTAEAARKNIIVVYIRHEFDGIFWKTFSKLFYWGTALKGTPGTEIDKRVNIISSHCFSKPAPNAFSNPEIEAFLNEHGVRELYLTGLDARFCVYETAKAAKRKGYHVTIIKDAIALKAENKWDSLLKQYDRRGIALMSDGEF